MLGRKDLPISRKKIILKHDDFALKKYIEYGIVTKSRKTKSRRFKIPKAQNLEKLKISKKKANL
jgi:hypothetical protein